MKASFNCNSKILRYRSIEAFTFFIMKTSIRIFQQRTAHPYVVKVRTPCHTRAFYRGTGLTLILYTLHSSITRSSQQFLFSWSCTQKSPSIVSSFFHMGTSSFSLSRASDRVVNSSLLWRAETTMYTISWPASILPVL